MIDFLIAFFIYDQEQDSIEVDLNFFHVHLVKHLKFVTGTGTDNKKLFTWTANLNYEQVSKAVKVTIIGPSDVHVTNAKFFLVKCNQSHTGIGKLCRQCDQKPCAIIQTQQNVWIADIGLDFPQRFSFKADIVRQISPYILSTIKNVTGLLTTGRYTDLVVFVKDQKFKCHKAMLMEKSPVFEAMVRNTLLDFVF